MWNGHLCIGQVKCPYHTQHALQTEACTIPHNRLVQHWDSYLCFYLIEPIQTFSPSLSPCLHLCLCLKFKDVFSSACALWCHKLRYLLTFFFMLFSHFLLGFSILFYHCFTITLHLYSITMLSKHLSHTEFHIICNHVFYIYIYQKRTWRGRW